MNRLIALPVLALFSCAEGPAPDRRPDVLLVSIDTLRADRVSCYGNERATTPFLDRIASEGVRFDAAHAPATNTTPSHMSMFTGLDPMTHGVHTARPSNKPTAALSADVPTLPQILRRAGWQTAAFTDRGGMPPSVGFGRGFEHLRSEWESLPAKLDAVGAHLDGVAEDRPLFVFFHTYEVHAPYLPPRDVHGRYADRDYRGKFRKRYEGTVDLPVNAAWDQKAHFLSRFDDMDETDVAFLSALYDEGVAYADHELERLWRTWSAVRDPENTLLVVLSDHGEEFLEHDGLGHKLSLYGELVRVPLVVRGRGVVRGVVRESVSLTGVFPTVLEYLGLPVPSRTQGASFLAALRDPAAPGELPPVFTQTDNRKNQRYESVAVGSLRLLRVTIRDEEELQLFDWSEDPLEQEDLIEARSDEVAELVRLLDVRRAQCDRLRAKIGPNPEQVLSEQEIDELEALGYVDDD